VQKGVALLVPRFACLCVEIIKCDLRYLLERSISLVVRFLSSLRIIPIAAQAQSGTAERSESGI